MANYAEWAVAWINAVSRVFLSINARVAIFEAKYTRILENLETACDTALQQIDDRMYAKEYEDDYNQILCYGISFFKKRCMIKTKWFTAKIDWNSVL